MEQEEVNEIQRLARIAVDLERAGKNFSELAVTAWRELCAYVMHIAADRANRALIYAKDNPEFLNE